MPGESQFRFALGQGVRWAGDTTHCYWIIQRRFTERDRLGTVVEYYLTRLGPHGLDVRWAYEADLACWEGTR